MRRRIKPSIGIQALPILQWSSGQNNKSNAKKSRFCPNRNSTGTIYHWSVILRRFSVVSISAKRDANGFFKVLLGCISFSQSKSGFCDRKFDFLFHWGLNQSKIAIRTICLWTWIVQICISIRFHIFAPFNETAFRSEKRARSSINTAGQG